MMVHGKHPAYFAIIEPSILYYGILIDFGTLSAQVYLYRFIWHLFCLICLRHLLPPVDYYIVRTLIS